MGRIVALLIPFILVSGGLIGVGAFVVVRDLGGGAQERAPVLLAPTVAPAPTTPPAAPTVPVGKVEINLGTRPFAYGSQDQTRDLLAAMDQQPGRAEYSVAYDTGVDAVAFGCELTTGILLRVHQERDGHGSREIWRGYVMDRLRSAAAGGSLNDTPAGKSLVDFARF